jgi:hypothetical protein
MKRESAIAYAQSTRPTVGKLIPRRPGVLERVAVTGTTFDADEFVPCPPCQKRSRSTVWTRRAAPWLLNGLWLATRSGIH